MPRLFDRVVAFRISSEDILKMETLASQNGCRISTLARVIVLKYLSS
jgi:predicted DNA binding CopG/RHH family protein